MANMESGLREIFLKAYANLPLSSRKEIIVVIDEKPITWDAAFLEVKNNTEMGIKILAAIERLGVFKK